MASPMADGVESAIAQVQRQGYAVLPGVISARDLELFRKALEIIEKPARHGDNEFAGRRTIRSHNLLGKTRIFDALISDPRILAIVEGILGRQIQISITALIKILPGETRQPLHQDDGLWPIARPHAPLVLNTIFAIDEFTASNGSTTIVPGSHRSTEPVDPSAAVVSVEMPAGSVLLWDGACWHGGGANTSTQPRTGLNLNYNLAWLRQQENQYVGVPRSELAKMPERLQRLLGYQVNHGILGQVDFRDPLKAVLDL